MTEEEAMDEFDRLTGFRDSAAAQPDPQPLRPSQCRDPELLGGVTPEAVVEWLTAHGWTPGPIGVGGGTPWGHAGTEERVWPEAWCRRWRDASIIQICSETHDLWPHEILAELLALSAAIKEG